MGENVVGKWKRIRVHFEGLCGPLLLVDPLAVHIEGAVVDISPFHHHRGVLDRRCDGYGARAGFAAIAVDH